MSDLKQKALSGVFWSALQQFGKQGIGFVVSVVLARLLLPEEFGLIAMIGIFMGIGASLMDAGLGSSLIRTKNPTQDDYSTVFYFNLIGSVAMYVLLFATAPLIANFYDQEILISIIRWYGIIFIINAFAMIQNTRLTKLMNFKTQMQIALPSTIIGGLVGTIMAYLGYGVWSLVVMAIIQAIASTLQLWFYSKWKPAWIFNIGKFKYHFKYGYKLTLSGLLNVVFLNAYTIIIGKFFAPAQVGFYYRADSLKQFPVNNISAILDKVTFPLFAEIKDDHERLKSIFKRMMLMVVYLIAPTLIFAAVLAEPLFRFLLTEKWLPAVPYFQILCFTGILYPIHAYNLNILKVKGRSDLFLKLAILKRSITLISIIIALQFGIYMLLISQVLVSIISFFINAYYTNKLINYSSWEQIKDILPILFLSLICSTGIYSLDLYLELENQQDIIRLIIGSSLGVISYISLSYIFKLDTLENLLKIILKK